MVELNTDFLLSASGILKTLRVIVAFMAAVSFGAKRSHEAFLALAIMECVITALFCLLYLLRLEKKMKSFLWPLAIRKKPDTVSMRLTITGLTLSVLFLSFAVLENIWKPHRDAFNSLVAALFLLIVGLCATLIKTILATLVGGIFCLVLCVLCIIDATLILKKFSLNRA